MSLIATGVFKTVVQKRQTALGTIATGGAATGQYLRRTKSTLDLAKATYKSNEILVSQQRRDFRHGVRSITGTISGELSVGGYQPFMESICRQVVQAVTTGTSQSHTIALVSGPPVYWTITRATGWIAEGFKIGDVITTATSGFNVANKNTNLLIIGLTATVANVVPLNGVALVAEGPIASSVFTTAGKKTYIPISGQTRDYYTIEHWFGDISQSEVFTDVVITDMAVKMPATGMSTIDFTCLGLNITTNTSEYFTSPTAAPTGGILASVNGVILVNGVVAGNVTSLDFAAKGNYSAPGGVVGANVDPDIFPGSVDVTGSMTILFQDATMRNLFINETEFAMAVALTANNTANSPFTAFCFPRCKAGGATKDDNEKGLALTMPFTALEQTGGSATTTVWLDTSISIMDSAFA
jgi:hypothetical protein